MFWVNLSPDGGDKPTGDLASAIDRDFGSFDLFQKHFTAVATTIQGSGWAILGVDTLTKKLRVLQLYDQQANVPLGIVPVVMLDMWEHAFYLDYQNVKPEYVKAWWNVVNWADAARRYEHAQGLSLVCAPTISRGDRSDRRPTARSTATPRPSSAGGCAART